MPHLPSSSPHNAHHTGATGLDKKARKQFEAGSLARLGAKAEKGPRIPASIGIGEGGHCAEGPGHRASRNAALHLRGAVPVHPAWVLRTSPGTYLTRSGMARKRAQREARATEEAIAAGMVSVRDLAKKRRRESSAARPRDQGLREDGGSFRAGVMRVAKAPSPSVKKGGRR